MTFPNIYFFSIENVNYLKLDIVEQALFIFLDKL